VRAKAGIESMRRRAASSAIDAELAKHKASAPSDVVPSAMSSIGRGCWRIALVGGAARPVGGKPGARGAA